MKISRRMTALLLLLSSHMATAADIAVTDDAGNPVRLNQPASRVISLSPHLTELMFTAGAGNRLIATVDYADYPQQASRLPRVGSNNAWDFERIVAMQPDLVLTWHSGNGDRLINKLRELGLTVYVSEPLDFQLISTNLVRLGQLTGSETIARQQAARFDAGIQALQQRYASKAKLKVFIQIWDEPLMTVNGDHLMSQVVQICGGNNVFADVAGLAPSINREAVLLANPEVFLFANQRDKVRPWLANWQQFAQLTAVNRQRYIFINPDLISRQTTRVLAGAESICRALDKLRED